MPAGDSFVRLAEGREGVDKTPKPPLNFGTQVLLSEQQQGYVSLTPSETCHLKGCYF